MSDHFTDRMQRIVGYSNWLRDDASGLAFNLLSTPRLPAEGSKEILTAARGRLLEAVETIDAAMSEIELDATLNRITKEIA